MVVYLASKATPLILSRLPEVSLIVAFHNLAFNLDYTICL